MIAQNFKLRYFIFGAFAEHLFIRRQAGQAIFGRKVVQILVGFRRVQQVCGQLNIIGGSGKSNPLPVQRQIRTVQIIAALWRLLVTEPIPKLRRRRTL
ncbi:hypothetical protein D3C85_1363810 [compost metagenome]